MQETKTCSACQNTLPISDYYFHKHNVRYLSKCKKCVIATVTISNEALRKSDPLAVATSQKKSQAKRNGVTFNLTRDYLAELWQQQDGKCAALGIPIEFNRPKNDDCGATIDRIIPEKGYIQGNVLWLSWLANRIKSNCIDPQVFRSIADYVEKNIIGEGATV